MKLLLHSLIKANPAYASSALAPVFGFGLYILLARAHNTTTLTNSIAFSALSLFALLERPMVTLIHGGRELVTVVNCFQRIQEYLCDPERMDCRSTPNHHFGDIEYAASRSNSPPDSSPESNNEKDRMPHCVELCNVSCSWFNEEQLILQELSLTIAREEITMIVGPVGCGKSSFLQLLLGEVPHVCGSVVTSYVHAAYCSQSPWLTFGTIQENIVASSPWDRSWYDLVIEACALDADLQKLADGDQTKLGARGSQISGGQQKRVVSD